MPATRRIAGRGAAAAPGAAAVEEGVEHADRGGAAARLGLLDDDLALPGQRVEHEHLVDAGGLEGLLGIEVAEVEDAFRSLGAERRGERVGGAGDRVVAFHRGGVGKAGLAVPLRAA